MGSRGPRKAYSVLGIQPDRPAEQWTEARTPDQEDRRSLARDEGASATDLGCGVDSRSQAGMTDDSAPHLRLGTHAAPDSAVSPPPSYPQGPDWVPVLVNQKATCFCPQK